MKIFTLLTRHRRMVAVAAVFGSTAFYTVNHLSAFNPQPDPPAFAALQVFPSETATLYAYCAAETPFGTAAAACDVSLSFRDAHGATLRQSTLNLRPGQTGFLELPPVEAVAAGGPSVIVPVVRPGMGGRLLPAVQVVERAAGRTSIYTGPVAPRLSFFGF